MPNHLHGGFQWQRPWLSSPCVSASMLAITSDWCQSEDGGTAVLARTTSSGGTSEPVGGRSPASTLSIVRTRTRRLRLPTSPKS